MVFICNGPSNDTALVSIGNQWPANRVDHGWTHGPTKAHAVNVYILGDPTQKEGFQSINAYIVYAYKHLKDNHGRQSLALFSHKI